MTHTIKEQRQDRSGGARGTDNSRKAAFGEDTSWMLRVIETLAEYPEARLAVENAVLAEAEG